MKKAQNTFNGRTLRHGDKGSTSADASSNSHSLSNLTGVEESSRDVPKSLQKATKANSPCSLYREPSPRARIASLQHSANGDGRELAGNSVGNGSPAVDVKV